MVPFVWAAVLVATATAAYCDASGVHDDLVEWVKKYGGVVSPHVKIADSRLSGKGVIATEPLQDRHTVFGVPLLFAMSAEHATVDDELGHIWKMLPDLSELDVFSGFLAFEMRRENKSFWSPYIACLTPGPMSTAVFSQHEMDFLAPSAAVHSIASRRNADLDEIYALIVEAATNEPSSRSAWQQLQMTKSDYLWAHTVLRSRAHFVPVKTEGDVWEAGMALMPLSDLFNGALGRDSPNVECYTGDEGYGTSGIFYCETTRPVLAGEELLVQYLGDPLGRASGRFLLNYGFVPEYHDEDSVLIEIPKASVHIEERLRKFNIQDVEQIPWINSRDECLKLRYTMYHTVLQLDEEGADISDNNKVNHHLLSRDTVRRGIQRMLSQIQSLLDKYPSVEEANEAALNGVASGRLRETVVDNILRLQANEKMILQRVIDMCTDA